MYAKPMKKLQANDLVEQHRKDDKPHELDHKGGENLSIAWTNS